MDQRAEAIHVVLAALASPLLLASQALVPGTPQGRCHALLLLAWGVFGWLLPTAILMPSKPHEAAVQTAAAAASAPAFEASGAAPAAAAAAAPGGGLEPAVRGLCPPHAGPGAVAGQHWMWHYHRLMWWVILSMAWGVCCLLARP